MNYPCPKRFSQSDFQAQLESAKQEAQSMTLAEAWKLIKDGHSAYKAFHDSEYARQNLEPNDMFDEHAIKLIDFFISANT